MYKKRQTTDVLKELKEIQFNLDQVNSDHLPNIQGSFFNKALNNLRELISDGERRQMEKLYPKDEFRTGL